MAPRTRRTLETENQSMCIWCNLEQTNKTGAVRGNKGGSFKKPHPLNVHRLLPPGITERSLLQTLADHHRSGTRPPRLTDRANPRMGMGCLLALRVGANGDTALEGQVIRDKNGHTAEMLHIHRMPLHLISTMIPGDLLPPIMDMDHLMVLLLLQDIILLPRIAPPILCRSRLRHRQNG